MGRGGLGGKLTYQASDTLFIGISDGKSRALRKSSLLEGLGEPKYPKRLGNLTGYLAGRNQRAPISPKTMILQPKVNSFFKKSSFINSNKEDGR